MNDDYSLSMRSNAGIADPLEAVGDTLAEAIDRRRRRIRLRLAAVAGIGVAVMAIVLGGGVLNSGPSQVLAVDTNSGEWITVRILDGQAGAEAMTSELQGAGINGEVKLLPATPDLVGHWMGVRVTNGAAPQCENPVPEGFSCANPPLLDAGEASMSGDVLQIRSDLVDKLGDSQLVFYVGRAPQGDEQARDKPPAN